MHFNQRPVTGFGLKLNPLVKVLLSHCAEPALHITAAPLGASSQGTRSLFFLISSQLNERESSIKSSSLTETYHDVVKNTLPD